MSSACRNAGTIVCAVLVLTLSGCATYRTPGGGVDVLRLSRADGGIADAMKREPAAIFPAQLALVRTQAANYSSASQSCYGRGRYCVLTVRELEDEADFAAVSRLPMIAGVAPMSRMLLPTQFDSFYDLRLAAAQLRTDMLLVYSVDTQFQVESVSLGPLTPLSLGMLPNKKAHVTSTASAVLLDVRTGFIYGVAEGSATEARNASVWSTTSAIDRVRLRTEAQSFHRLVDEFGTLWKKVVEEHAASGGPSPPG